MGFQKLEPITFDLMFVDKWYTQKTQDQVWGNKLLQKVKEWPINRRFMQMSNMQMN